MVHPERASRREVPAVRQRRRPETCRRVPYETACPNPADPGCGGSRKPGLPAFQHQRGDRGVLRAHRRPGGGVRRGITGTQILRQEGNL